LDASLRSWSVSNEMNLEHYIEGVLFYKAEPVKKTVLKKIFDISDEILEQSCMSLQERLTNGATRLTITDKEVQLTTAPELSETIETIRKDELRKDIGRAGAETLAIILYRGPLSRADIDRVRGVNSTFIIRSLLIRGLVERRNHPTNKQSFIYNVTPNLFNHLGITKKEDLPQFSEIMDSLDKYDEEQSGENNESKGVFEQQT